MLMSVTTTDMSAINPCFYFNAGKFGLEGYRDFSYNFGVLVRIVMNDSMFSK